MSSPCPICTREVSKKILLFIFFFDVDILFIGILFGKMVLELGDTSTARNEKTGLTCDVIFKTKVCTINRKLPMVLTMSYQGMFSGTYNAVGGKVKRDNGADVGEVSGTWSHSMHYKSAKVRTD